MQKAFGINADIDLLLGSFEGNPECLYRYIEEDASMTLLPRLRPERRQRIQSVQPEDSYAVINRCAKDGIDIITQDDAEYPPLLREAANRPAVLYAVGETRVLKSTASVAMVGTRNPTLGVPQMAAELAGTLACCGYTVVSGGALGLDSACHAGAMNAGGKTVAVLGCGIYADYLSSNHALWQAIAQNGAVISEMEPYSPPARGTFPVRNRIIAGMTAGTIALEAGVKSGTMITTKHAMEMGRAVMALPFEKIGSGNAGSRDLIADGADAVCSAADVLRVLGSQISDEMPQPLISEDVLSRDITELKEFHFSPLPSVSVMQKADEQSRKERNGRRAAEKRKLAEDAPVSKEARALYESFGREPLSIEQLELWLQVPVNRVLCYLSELEIAGVLETTPDGKFYYKQDG